MQSVKSAFGIVTGLIPVVYCLGFLIYFANVEQFTGVPVGNALGPTIIGLGVVALLFSIPLILRIARLFRPAPPAPDEARRTAEVFADGPSDFDPDAAIARYLSQRGDDQPGTPAGQAPAPASSPAAAPSPGGAPPPPRPAFGRKRG